MTSKHYCANLQSGLYLDFNSQEQTWAAAPCCQYRGAYPVNQSINEEYWKHDKIFQIRQDNLDGKELPDECFLCKETESSGNKSRRQGINERFGTHWAHSESVVESNFQADYSCNLACRICNSNLSTTWRKYDPDYKNNSKIFKVRAEQKNVIDLLSTVKFNELKQIQFQGGEPLLTLSHMEVLESLTDQVDLKQVALHYNTNGTVRVSEKIMKFWERFRMVEIYFSLDDIGPRFEYQRWPAVWNEVRDNMLWYRDNLPHNALLGVERTMGILNSYWAEELDAWLAQNFAETKYGDKIQLNYHQCAREYAYGALSQEYIDAILETVSESHWVHKQVSQLKEGSEKEIKTMLAHIKKHDSVRNQNYAAIYPEFNTWYKRFL